MTGVTVASMTVFLTVVQFAGEELVTDERAGMFHPDAAELSTLVPPAAPLLLTSPPTPSIVRPARHLGAGQFLVHVATAAADTCGEGAGGAGAQVTGGLAVVGGGGGAAGQGFITD